MAKTNPETQQMTALKQNNWSISRAFEAKSPQRELIALPGTLPGWVQSVVLIQATDQDTASQPNPRSF